MPRLLGGSRVQPALGVSLSNDNAWVSDRNVAIDRGPALPAWSCPGSAVTRARLLE